MMRRPGGTVSSVPRVLRAVAVGVCLLGMLTTAHAVKWRNCPSSQPLRMNPSKTGATNAPFVHPGHELGIFLSLAEVHGSGGFSTEPGGNTVAIQFASLFGDPIQLPSFKVAAVSSSSLFFTFPDVRPSLGRDAAGPVEIVVRTGDQTTAHILPRDFVALPPANDVQALLQGGFEQAALATLDTQGSVWVPVQFSGLGVSNVPMPNCPMLLVPITSFTVGITVRTNPHERPPLPTSYPPFRGLEGVDLFLGDLFLNTTNYYGMNVGKLRVFRIPRGWGIRICSVNDAVDIVLRARGWQRWAKPWSDFATWMPDSRPLEIVLSNLSANPPAQNPLVNAKSDALGVECLLP
jgi:hypothetical protein